MCFAHVLLLLALAQTPTVSTSGTFVPAQPTGTAKFFFVLQLQSTAPLEGATATITAPGFTVTTPTQDIPEGVTTTALVFQLEPTDASPAAGLVLARLSGASDSPLGDTHFTFTYSPRVSLRDFYLLAGAGILAGWIAKLLVKIVAGKKPRASLAHLAPSGNGRVATWLQGALESAFVYYCADFVLTLAIGYVVLLAMTQDGAAPAAASHWQGALVAGFGLGVLTPQDLLAKTSSTT